MLDEISERGTTLLTRPSRFEVDTVRFSVSADKNPDV